MAARLAVRLLMEAGFEAGVVGGCNRDAIMGKTPDDWDICTSATPEEIQFVFKDFKQLIMGLKHGTVTIIINKEPIEITTYRIDGEYSDGRRPDYVAFTRNLVEDLSRRDYTINAIFYNEVDGIVDPFNGVQDIEHQIIRCVGDPNKRLQEDALRILRGIRFASKLAFKVDELTKQAMFDTIELLKNVSQERITVEFVKLLQGKEAVTVLNDFREIICYILPEIKPIVGFYPKEDEYDLWQHSVTAFGNATDFIVKLTMLFHDIAKPLCTDKNICNAAKASAQITSELFKRMRFTNAQGLDRNDLTDIIELIVYHNTAIEPSKIGVKKMLSKLSGNSTQFKRLLAVKRADFLAQKNAEPKSLFTEMDTIEQLFYQVLEDNPCTTVKHLAITGKDLTSIGIPKGEIIGTILNQLLDEVIDETLVNTPEALLEAAKNMYKLPEQKNFSST